MPFILQPLDYSIDSLQPHLSADTVDQHYNIRTKQYFNMSNQLFAQTPMADFDDLTQAIHYSSSMRIDGPLLHNLCSAWNHQFFWQSIAPKSPIVPSVELSKEIAIYFNSIEELEEQFVSIGSGGIGSHWTWLVVAGGQLQIRNTPNSTTPVLYPGTRPLLAVDGWEHAYYDQYRTDKRKYYEAVWQLINWERVNDRFAR